MMSKSSGRKVPKATSQLLVVFDFDHTLVDVDSDLVLFQSLPYGQCLLPCFASLREVEGLAWTQIMQRQLTALAAQEDYSKADVLKCVRNVKIDPALLAALRTLRECQTPPVTLVIASDANTVFINQILEANGVDVGTFSRIYTNGGRWSPDDVLEVQPYQSVDAPHGCPRACPANMCKTSILQRARRELGLDFIEDLRTIYVGDGGNDFCPSLSLTAGDLVLARNGFTLQKLIYGGSTAAVRPLLPADSSQAGVVNVDTIEEAMNAESTQRNSSVAAEVRLWESQGQLGCMLRSVLGEQQY